MAEGHRECLDRLAKKYQRDTKGLQSEIDALKRQVGLCTDFMDHYSRLYRRMLAENETVIEGLRKPGTE